MLTRRRLPSRLLVLSCVLALGACDDGPILTDADAGPDGAAPMPDGGTPMDASSLDGGPLPDPDGGADGGTDAGTDAGPPCEELDPTAPSDPASGAWLAEFNNPGVGGGTGLRPGVGAFAFGADGSLYVGGNFTTAGYTPVSNVAAWHPASGWRALGDGLPKAVVHLTFGADGSLYAVHGQPDSSTAYRISRWDGTSWSTFADADGSIAELDAVGDRLIAVGGFTEIGGAAHAGVAYHDGAAWQGYAGLAPDRGVQTVSATGPDDVCIAGQFNTLGVIVAQNVACWNGTEWEARSLPLAPPSSPSIPPRPGTWSVNDLQRDPADGSLVAGGNFRIDESETTGGGIARWTGSTWELIGGGVMEFGPGGTGNVLGIAFAASGLYIGGAFRLANPSLDPLTEVNDAARWDGTRWHAMSSGLFADGGIGIGARPAAAGAVAATPDGGSVFFGGTMNRADTMSVGHVVRWDGTYWRGLRASGERYYGLSGHARAFARRGTCEIYVGGDFIYAGEVRANNIARFTREGGYEALGDGVLGVVEAIEVTRDGRVYASGNFVDESGTVLRNLAMWDGTEWTSVGGGVDHSDGPTSATALAIGEGRGPGGADLVYVAGTLDQAGGERSSGFVMWDGSAWTDLGAGMQGHERPSNPGTYNDPRVNALLVDPDTGDLIVAGSFRAVGENDLRIETNNIARWDGSAWHAFGDGAGDRESPVISATLWNGRVAIARQFVNDDPLRFAVWTGTEWEAIGEDQPGFTIPSGIDGIGDSLFVAGGWTDGRHAAVFDGTAWHPLGDGTSDGTSAVLAIEGGVLYGGPFNRAGDTGSGGIGFWQYAE